MHIIIACTYTHKQSREDVLHSAVESSHPVKHRQAQWLLTKVLAQRNREVERNTLRPTIRVGLSGSPGAGKSTLIESLGLRLVEQGLRVAVLVSRMLLTYINWS